jgi:hypothetical protein
MKERMEATEGKQIRADHFIVLGTWPSLSILGSIPQCSYGNRFQISPSLGRLILNYYCTPEKNVISPFDSHTMTPSRAAILRLINASQHSSCPCHGSHTSHNAHMVYNQLRRLATPVEKVDKEYAFEVWYLLCLLARFTFNLRHRLLHPIFVSEMASLVRSVWT